MQGFISAKGSRSRGFTLLELLVVIGLIGLVMAVAAPQFWGTLAYTELENSARQVANYGRAVVAEAALTHGRFTVIVDLHDGTLWAERWVDPTAELLKRLEQGEDVKMELAAFETEYGQLPDGLSELLDLPGTADPTVTQGLLIEARFEHATRVALIQRARNVEHEGILSDIGPLFEDDLDVLYGLAGDNREESMTALLSRRFLSEGVAFESVKTGTENWAQGQLEIEVASTGLYEPVTFYLHNDRGEYLTVVWDAVTRDAQVYEGRKAV